ncbi:MAG: Rho termination factor N-terminal domain-containing protein, partial [Bacteroidales bacterium]|nr:Rho termination factor N-terminal domain-containing protein [Bacteroidales bacterium]
MHDILELSEMLVPELREIAKQLKIKRAELLKKQDLIYKILDQQAIDAAEARKTGRPDSPPAVRQQQRREPRQKPAQPEQQKQGPLQPKQQPQHKHQQLKQQPQQ